MKQLNFSFLLAVLISMLGIESFAITVGNVNYNFINNNSELSVAIGDYSGNFVIPSSVAYDGKIYKVTKIETGAFKALSGLTSVSIPNSVTDIGNEAFKACKNLTSVTIGDNETSVTIGEGVTRIGNAAFESCSNLSSLTISNNVNSITGAAFRYCTALTSVVIPNSVTFLGGDAFCGCSGLTSVSIGNSVTTIGGGAFNGCISLTSVTIPNSVTTIESAAFYGCKSLASIIIGNNVTDIGYIAFFNCSSLTSITIPGSVAKIGNEAFRGCYNLISVTVLREEPVSINNLYTFSNRRKATLYVPAGCKDAYATASHWKEFNKILEIGVQVNQTLELTELPAMTYGDDPYTLPSTTKEGLTLTWTSNNIEVVTINEDKLTIKKAGIATITATQEGNDEYLPFSREFTLTIGKASLKITANNQKKQEGEDNPALTVKYEGFKYSDNASSFTTQPTVTTAATKDSPAGTYSINVSGAKSDNYTISYVNGTLTITEKPQGVTDISLLDNAIYIEPCSARIGGDVNIEIRLKNAQAASAYNFDLVLPEGVTVAKDSNGRYIDALSDRHDDHTRTFNYKGDNVYSFATLSGNSEALMGSDGAIRLVTLHVADVVAEGTYAIEIKNASYSQPNGTEIALPNTVTSITAESYVLGDVNGNSHVDIGDAVSIVNYLVGKPSTTFVEKAADTNKNGHVDIGDAVTIVNLLVGKTASLSRNVNNECEPQ